MWVRRQWRGSIGFTRRGSAGGRRCRGVQTGYGDSPYQSLSSFAGNPLLISPDWLIEDGLLRASDCAGGSFSAAAVDFDAVKRFKYTLLETAWGNFRTGARSDLRLAFELFTQAHADWLDDYALFRALKARYGGASYLQWPEDLVRRTPAALEQARRDLASQVEEVRFAQFLLSVQGARLKAHARAKGVRLIGDLPFFVSPDSSDVWANPELFLLDAHYRPRVVAGVPPDYFSSQGQRWGNPIYDWDALAARGYRWCINRVRALLAHVDAIRLDHFRGFAAAWHIPSGAPDAQTGQWMPGPGATTEKTNGRSQSTDTAASAAGQQIHEHQIVAVRAAAAVQTRPATTAATEEVKRDRN